MFARASAAPFGFGRKFGRLVVDFTKSLADLAQLDGGGPVPATIAATGPLVAAGRRAGWPLALIYVTYAAVHRRP